MTVRKGQLMIPLMRYMDFPGGSVVKNSPINGGDTGSILDPERSHGEGNGNSLQYSCLENPMDRGAWRDSVHKGHRVRTEY